jgi:polysaccharide biosynthesis protein PslH
MKILYLATRECWPLNTGARLRDYHLARQLALRCAVTYVGLHDPRQPDEEQPPEATGFAEYAVLARGRGYTAAKSLRGLIGPTPVTVLNYFSRRAAAQLAKILERGGYDAVQLEGVHLMGYLPVIRAAASRARVLADWHNIESEVMGRYSTATPGVARSLAARRTAGLIERAENRLLAACDIHTVTSDRERRILEGRHTPAEIHVVPNGVDVEHFSEREIQRAREGQAAEAERRSAIIFVGSMDYHANIDAVLWFGREVWPGLRAQNRGFTFTVVGRNPTAGIKALTLEGISVTGTVADVRPHYAGALATVVPIRVAGGTRLKILESMAAGIPVVSTRIGAEGLDVEDRRQILLADTAQDFLAAIEHLASTPGLWRSLSTAGRALVRANYDWAAVGETLYSLHCRRVKPERMSG